MSPSENRGQSLHVPDFVVVVGEAFYENIVSYQI